jgi:hypothetical protein
MSVGSDESSLDFMDFHDDFDIDLTSFDDKIKPMSKSDSSIKSYESKTRELVIAFTFFVRQKNNILIIDGSNHEFIEDELKQAI